MDPPQHTTSFENGKSINNASDNWISEFGRHIVKTVCMSNDNRCIV